MPVNIDFIYICPHGNKITKDLQCWRCAEVGFPALAEYLKLNEEMRKESRMVWLNDCHSNITPPPGTFGGSRCTCKDCEEKRKDNEPVMRRCLACGKEKPAKKMKICMHNQMHRYVCDTKCMCKFYATRWSAEEVNPEEI